jgi:hypothetical protein
VVLDTTGHRQVSTSRFRWAAQEDYPGDPSAVTKRPRFAKASESLAFSVKWQPFLNRSDLLPTPCTAAAGQSSHTDRNLNVTGCVVTERQATVTVSPLYLLLHACPCFLPTSTPSNIAGKPNPRCPGHSQLRPTRSPQ